MKKRCIVLLAAVVAIPCGLAAQKKMPSTTRENAPARVSLSPQFTPGQVFRYSMEFQTTTATSRSGLATDPQGPTKLVITWDATIRMDVLPADDSTPGGIRLRTTYEKSTANVTSDTFDPTAFATQEQYQKLEGKVMEFTLDAGRNVKSVSGLEGIVDGEKAVLAAREWIAELEAGSGAPAGGVAIGQTWSSDQPATSLPVAGLVWHTQSEYVRNEACHPANAEIATTASSPQQADNSESTETCAVILTHLVLVRPKSARDSTPQEYRRNGVQSAGRWNGTGQSMSYISLQTGMVVSVTQDGTEDMDVTLTTGHNTSMHYAGTVLTRSQVALVKDDVAGK